MPDLVRRQKRREALLAALQAEVEQKVSQRQPPEQVEPQLQLERPIERPAERPLPEAPEQPLGAPISPPVPELAIEPPEVEEPRLPEGPEPFWQRALQIFSAPFEWIDENIIKPGLATAGTALGIVKEVERLEGEDFFEWKKRSWAQWETPGIDVNVPWSEDDLRLDVRGVLEFAPWLLMPGAGQVGTGVRAARGVAGIAGKFGQAGRVLGRAVEFSPWGLVEKTAGVAIKGVGKGIGRVVGGVGERVFGKYVPVPPTAAEQKIIKFFPEVAVARVKFEKALPKGLRAKQEAITAPIFKRAEQGKITFAQAEEQSSKALAKLGGIRAGFAVKAEAVTKGDMDELFSKIVRETEYGLEQKTLVDSLRKTLTGVDLPEPGHIKAFARIFGRDFAKAVKEFTQKPLSTREKILDLLNLPRAVLASGDLSGTLRQGLFLGLVRPQDVPRAFWRQLKYFASEKLSLDMDDVLRSRPLYRKATQEWGVEFTSMHKGAQMLAKEEIFASNLAQNMPFVRRSERAFTGFLNEMRMGAVEGAYGAMTAQGASKTQFKLMGQFINLASGRGTLPANLNRYAPVLNTVLFSAKYQMSTLQLPRQLGRMLLSKNPYMRKEAALALTTFIGGGSAILGLFQTSGQGKVELDPRSGDFGKIVIGKTRLDIWRGYIQYARFAAQLLSGERKSAYGNMNKVERGEIVSRFLQSKSSPAFGLMVDLLKGESYMGEPLFNETTGFIKTVRDRLLPLALQDTIDAIEQSGVNGVWVAAPAALGIGVLTYVNDLVRVKERIARDAGYDNWDAIDPKTQREIQNSNVELQTAYLDFDRQVMGTAFGDYRNAGQAVEEVFKENVNMAVAQYRETEDGVLFRKKVSEAFSERRGGYAAREKEERFSEIAKRNKIKDPVKSLIALGPQMTAIKLYNEALFGEDMYDEFGDYRFDEAEIRKEELRTQLDAQQEGLFDYVEEYRGLSFEDFPSEFQELTKAKKVLREYWGLENWYKDKYGKPKSRGSQRLMEAFVARQKKRLRLNDEVEKYYQMFYKKPSKF